VNSARASKHRRHERPAGHALGQIVVPRMLLDAELEPVEKLQQTENLKLCLRRGRVFPTTGRR